MEHKKVIGLFLLVLFITLSAVTAADTTADSNSTITAANDLQSTDADVQTTSQIDNTQTSTMNIGVNYEYEDDSEINPTVTVSDSDKNKLTSTKTYDDNLDFYYVSVDHNMNESIFNVSVTAPGYIPQSQTYKLNTTKSLVFNLKASDSYKLGRTITETADKELNFASADDVLVITTAGVPKYNNQTSEDLMEAILNYAEDKVSFGKGNMIMLRQTAVDPIDTCFVVKKGNSLTAMVFNNASTKYSYLGTISEDMTKEEWNAFYKAVGGEDSYSFASIANGWNHNVTQLVLQEAGFHGHICEGTLGGFSITEALMQYYPPIQETSVPFANPGDLTSYKVLGVPGDSANDAVLFFLDATAGKSGYVGFNTTSTGANSNMIGFVRWRDGTVGYNEDTNAYEVTKPGSGTLIVMEYDSENNKKQFQEETGINPDDGTLEELKYNSWWIDRINTNPGSLVNILVEKDNLSEEDYYYLIGLNNPITYPSAVATASNAGQVRINATEAHGLDYNYILGLDLPNATRSNVVAAQGTKTYNDFKKIGKDASLLAKKYFKEELGVEIEKDMPNFEVLTTAGYAFLDQQSTAAAWDGITEVFGSRLTRETLLPNHRPMWKPLWFTFVLKQDDGQLMALYMRYNNNNGTFYVGQLNGSHINNINIETLNNSELCSQLTATAFPDGNWFNIQSLTNVWAEELQFDQFLTFLFHGHACPGVQPGFFMSEYIQENYPLSENESYFYIASSIYCKDDSIEYLLGISPGLGNYMDQKLVASDVESDYVDGATEEGVLVVWDDELKVGKAVIMNFKWATIDTSDYVTSDAKRAAQIQAYVDLYKGKINPNLKEGVTIEGTETRWITEDEYNMLKSGSGDELNAISFIQSIDNRTKDDAIRMSNANNNQSSDNGNTNTNTDDNNTNTNNNNQQNNNQQNSNNNQNTNNQNTNNNRQTNTNSYSSPRSSSSSSPNTVAVGTTVAATAPLAENTEQTSEESQEETPESSESPEPSSGKAYEVSQNTPTNNNSMNILYFAGSLILVGGLAGYGFMRYRKQ